MIKGCRRDLVVMETTGSTLFERAFFVLRAERPHAPAADMLAEAERLIGAGCAPPRRRGRRLALFFCGVAVGAGVVLLLHALCGF